MICIVMQLETYCSIQGSLATQVKDEETCPQHIQHTETDIPWL